MTGPQPPNNDLLNNPSRETAAGVLAWVVLLNYEFDESVNGKSTANVFVYATIAPLLRFILAVAFLLEGELTTSGKKSP